MIKSQYKELDFSQFAYMATKNKQYSGRNIHELSYISSPSQHKKEKETVNVSPLYIIIELNAFTNIKSLDVHTKGIQ